MNINATRVKTDTEDNNNHNRYQTKSIDFRGIAVVVAIAAICVFAGLLVLYIVMQLDCWLKSGDCNVTTYMFYGYISILGIGLVIGISYLAARLYQSIRNSAFIRGMSMPMHRKDIRKNVERGYAVEMELAKAEMYRGLDALTTSSSSTSTSTNLSNDTPMNESDKRIDMAVVLDYMNKK